MLGRREVGANVVAAGLALSTTRPKAQTSAAQNHPLDFEIALFRDATETLFALAERLHAADPSAPAPPRRYFVKNADEAHRLALEGPNPIVGMSLDDLLECSQTQHPAANQLVTFCGVHRGFLQLIARPGIGSIAELKGRRVAVDTDTGYASALYEILRRNGIDRRRDVEVVYAGATDLRYAKLLNGEFDATLLGAPFTRLALRQAYSSLGSVIGALGGYQAVVLVAHRRWLATHAADARALTDCLIRSLEWTRQPGNRLRLTSLLEDVVPKLNESAAEQVADDLFGTSSEFLFDGRLRDGDARVVLDLYNSSRGASLTPDVVEHLTVSDYLDS